MMMKWMKKKNTNAMVSADGDETSLVKDSKGLSTVEYLILLVVIAVAGITVWQKVAKSISDKAATSSRSLDTMK